MIVAAHWRKSSLPISVEPVNESLRTRGLAVISPLHEVARGGSVLDPRVVEALVSAKDRMAHSPLATLTEREREVLSLMAQGRNNAGIAEALFLTERAVEKHINSMFHKLGLSEEPNVHRRVMAVLAFLRERNHA